VPSLQLLYNSVSVFQLPFTLLDLTNRLSKGLWFNPRYELSQCVSPYMHHPLIPVDRVAASHMRFVSGAFALRKSCRYQYLSVTATLYPASRTPLAKPSSPRRIASGRLA
jgi:hypothetical protein